MKNYIFLSLLLVSALQVCSQHDSIQPPYKRFPSFPPARLLTPDSVTYFTKADLPKKAAVMLMIFNPQCEHCQHETEDIIQHIDAFKKVQIVMAAVAPFDSMMAFREKYKLTQYENIIVAQDKMTFLPTFFMLHNLPFLAFYNRKKELIDVFEGALPIPRMLEILEK